MPNRPTITIPQPCHESWAQMTPATQGRHCAACDKVVVDFTRMTDAEVVVWLQHPRAGRTCGRFATQQLNRPLLVLPTPAPRWQKWVAATAAVVGLQAGVAHIAQAQRITPTGQHTITMGAVAVPRRVEPIGSNLPPTVVRGCVLDSASREPLPGVTVLIVGTQIGISTNTNGEFELEFPIEFSQSTAVEVQFSTIGYTNQIHVFNPKEPKKLRVALAADGEMLSGVVVVGGYSTTRPWYTPRGLWQRATRPFRRH